MVGVGRRFTVTGSVDAVPLPQLFVPATEIVPVIPPLTLVVMILVLFPEVMVKPEGNVQLYPVAPVMEATE
jgi:hypothetical protein